MIYLDAGATTLQKPPAVAFAVQSAMRRMATPGRGGHPPAMRAADAGYDCRCLVGSLFGAQPEQVVFTMNATHALNLAIKTLVKPGGRAVISGFEHNAVLRPLHHIGANITAVGRQLFDPADTLAAFDRAVTPDTNAVVCSYLMRHSRRDCCLCTLQNSVRTLSACRDIRHSTGRRARGCFCALGRPIRF